MPDPSNGADTARRALRCLDLTDLTDTCTDHAIDGLFAKALTPHGPVAAVCIWPQFVARAQDALKGSPVSIATVVNFPAGGENVDRVMEDVSEALGDGANEIDLVLPYRAVQRGDLGAAAEMVAGSARGGRPGPLLKVILETGELADPALIETASRIAIEAEPISSRPRPARRRSPRRPKRQRSCSTPSRRARRPVGLKPSGGIRTVSDAALYLGLADRIMGPGWATPRTFRIGASSLYDALIAALEGRSGPAAEGVY